MSDAFNAPMGGFSGDMSPGGPPAEFGPRLIARIIDIGLMIALVIPVVIVATVLGAISDVLGLLVGFALYFAIIAAGIYIIVGGQALTGQSPGQRMQGVKIVTDGGQLLGWGPAIIRWLVGGVFNSVLCGLPIGSLWMLWDGEKKTLYDKVLNNQAVTVPKGSITPIFPGGSPF